MRIISLLTAVLVTAALYVLVFERDRLSALMNGQDVASVAPAAPVETPTDTTDAKPADELIKVVAIVSKARSVDSAVVLRGETEADRSVTVKAETSGQVISAPLRKGSTVKAGDILCEIDPGTRAASLAEAKARLEEAKISLNAASKLSQGGFASETRLANAQSSALSGEAAVAAMEKELTRTKITAPFGGLLETDTAELGTLLQPGAPCATIIQLNPIKLVGFVPETEWSRVTLGAMAGAKLISGRTVQGAVTFLSRSADPTTRTFRVEIQVDNSDQSIADGQTAEIMIASNGTQAHLLPQSSLTLNDDGVLGVRLVGADNIVAFAPVSIIRDTAQGVWVSGLDEQANVIIVGQEYVRHGVAVDPTYQEVTQ